MGRFDSREHIDGEVEHGWVTLTGAVDHPCQAADAAGEAGRVAGITKRIAIRPGPIGADLRNRILIAFERQADSDAASIKAEVDGGAFKFTGWVKAWTERNAAARVVSAAPGVTSVVNDIAVGL